MTKFLTDHGKALGLAVFAGLLALGPAVANGHISMAEAYEAIVAFVGTGLGVKVPSSLK